MAWQTVPTSFIFTESIVMYQSEVTGVLWTLLQHSHHLEEKNNVMLNPWMKNVCAYILEKKLWEIYSSTAEEQIGMYILDVYYTGKHGIQENGMKWARNVSHFPGICGVLPYENHMTTGRLACQLKHVQHDLTELCVCQFITGILIQF